MISTSTMSRTTAKLGVFLFGLVSMVSGLLTVLDPEPGTAPRPVMAGALVLIGLVSIVKSFGMMRDDRSTPAKRVPTRKRASVT
jgi:uncharacterized membrane protein HdeD (DUF308 family)